MNTKLFILSIMLRTRICILAALLSVLAASPVLALEAASPAGDKATSAPVRKAASTATSAPRTSARGRVVIIRGNEESAAARERRLKRECRGRPNAGACLGFAS